MLISFFKKNSPQFIFETIRLNIWQERGRWFLWWPVGMGIGISYYMGLYHNPKTPFLLLLIVLALGASLFFRKGGAIMLSAIWGFLCIHAETLYQNTYMLSTPEFATNMQGPVESIERRPYNIKLVLQTPNHPHLKRVQLKTSRAATENIEPGDIITCDADLIPISPPVSPLGYDFRRACFFQGIGATGKVYKLKLVQKNTQNSLSKLRFYITQTIRKHIPGKTGEIAAALTTGYSRGIPTAVREQFANAGIAHILAISGLHVSLIAGLIFIILRRGLDLISHLNLHYPLKKIAAASSLPFVFAYVAISGFGFPAVRAFIMVSIVMAGIIYDRPPFSMRSVAIAATLILTWWPSALMGASFQLSFAAVIGLVAFYESRFDGIFSKITDIAYHKLWGRPAVYVLSILATTIIATLATTPLTIATFNQFTLQSVWGNLIAIPLTGFWIMPLGLACLISILWGGQASWFALWKMGIYYLMALAKAISSWPGASILVETPHNYYIVGTTLAFLWLCLWRTRWRFAGFPVLILCQILLATHPRNVSVFVSPQGIAYIHNGTLFTAKPKKFIDEQWAKQSGCRDIIPWETSWHMTDENVLVQHPWMHEEDHPDITPSHQIVCHLPPPYSQPFTFYRSSGYGLSPAELAKHTFYIDRKNHITYLNHVRSPNRPWS